MLIDNIQNSTRDNLMSGEIAAPENGLAHGFTYDRLIDIIAMECPDGPPSSATECESNVAPYETTICAQQALKIIADNWTCVEGPSPHEKRKFQALLPWSNSWLLKVHANNVAERRSTSSTVTKKHKLALLKIFHPDHAPKHTDSYKVAIKGGGFYQFKPYSWISATAKNWTGGKARMVLTPEEMKELEDIPWFLHFVNEMSATRKSSQKRIRDQCENQPNFAMKDVASVEERLGVL